MKASHVLVLLVVALVVLLMQFAPSTASQVSVRFKVVSDVNVTKYNVGVLAGYQSVLAAFVRDGVLYIAYENFANGSNIVRVDTGEIVKVCSFSDYYYFDYIVAGRGTAYGVMNYWVPGAEWGTKIIDLWNCEVLAVFENAKSSSFMSFWYDMYADKLLYGFFVYNVTTRDDINYVALVDVATGGVKKLFFGVRFNFTNNKWYVSLLALYVGLDYYYVVTEDFGTTPSTFTMYIYDKDLEHLVGTVPWDPNAEKVPIWSFSSDVAINAYGVLQQKYVRDDGFDNYWLKLVMYDALFRNATEYVTDADSVASSFGGVVAYRDLFVFQNGKSEYCLGEEGTYCVPYAFMLLPNIGLAVNTSIAGFAIPVSYELWSNNRVVLFNPVTGDVYLVDPPAIVYTVTETVTASVAFTTTVTMSPPSSFTISPLLPLLLIIAITAGIIGFMKASARSVLKHTLEHAMVFVKKKHAYPQ